MKELLRGKLVTVRRIPGGNWRIVLKDVESEYNWKPRFGEQNFQAGTIEPKVRGKEVKLVYE